MSSSVVWAPPENAGSPEGLGVPLLQLRPPWVRHTLLCRHLPHACTRDQESERTQTQSFPPGSSKSRIRGSLCRWLWSTRRLVGPLEGPGPGERTSVPVALRDGSPWCGARRLSAGLRGRDLGKQIGRSLRWLSFRDPFLAPAPALFGYVLSMCPPGESWRRLIFAIHPQLAK